MTARENLMKYILQFKSVSIYGLSSEFKVISKFHCCSKDAFSLSQPVSKLLLTALTNYLDVKGALLDAVKDALLQSTTLIKLQLKHALPFPD